MDFKNKKIIYVGAAIAVAALGVITYVIIKKSKKDDGGGDNTSGGDSTTGADSVISWCSRSDIIFDTASNIANITVGPGEVKLTSGAALIAYLPQNLAPAGKFSKVLNASEYSTSIGVPTNGSWIIRCYDSLSKDGVGTFQLHWSPNNADGSKNTTHFFPAPSDGTLTLKQAISVQINTDIAQSQI